MKRSVTDFRKERMERRLRIMNTYLHIPIKENITKEGILVRKSQRGMNAKETYPQEDILPPGIKEASIIVKEAT